MINSKSMFGQDSASESNYFESYESGSSTKKQQPSKREAMFFIVSFSLFTLMSLATAMH